MRSLLATTMLVLSVAGPALAGSTFNIQAIATEGQPAGGVGNITSIDNLAVNDAGSWIVEVDTDFGDTNADGLLLKDGALHLREGQLLTLPAGATLDSFDSVNLNNSGHSGWNFFLGNTGSLSTDSGMFFDASLIFQESFVSTASGFSPGTPYIGFFDSKINDSGQVMVVASIDDPAIASTVDRALVRLQLDAGGALVSETVLYKEGEALPGQVETVADFGTGPHQTAFNDAGDVLYFADLNGLTTTDGVIYLNGTLLAQEGSASPVAGRNWELLSSRGLDLSDTGHWVAKGNLDGATGDDELVLKDGAVFVREGGTLPAIAGFAFTAFGLGSGPVQVDDAGDVLWFGDWDDPNLDKDTGLFFNDQLVVAEGDQLGGLTIDEIANGEDAFQISDDGQWIVFEATLVGGVSVAFRIEVIDAPVPVVISDLVARSAGDRIRIEWQVADPDLELSAVEIERAEAEQGPYERLAVLAPETRMTFEDVAVAAGREYWYRLVAVGVDGARTIAGPVAVTSAAAWRTALDAAFESPQDGSVRLRYSVARAGTPVTFSIHDVRGRLLWSLSQTPPAQAGLETRWDRRDIAGARVPRGVYLVQMQADGVRTGRKVVVAQP